MKSYKNIMIAYNISMFVFLFSTIQYFLLLYLHVMYFYHSCMYSVVSQRLDKPFASCYSNNINGVESIYNNSLDAFLFVISTIVVIVFIKIFQRISFSMSLHKSEKENKKIKKENKIKKEIDQYINEKFKKLVNVIIVKKTKTHVSGKTIYISYKDIFSFYPKENNKKLGDFLFIISHEMFHMKIYDGIVSYINNILIQIFKFFSLFVYFFVYSFVAIIISNKIDPLNQFSASSVLRLLIISMLLFFTYLAVKKSSRCFNNFKECLCDRYAGIMLRRNDLTYRKSIFSEKSKTHPEKKYRIECSNGNIIFSECIPISIMTIYFFSYIPLSIYDKINIYYIFVLVISFSVVISINIYIAKSKKIFYITVFVILLSNAFLYLKSYFYMFVLIKTIDSMNINIEYLEFNFTNEVLLSTIVPLLFIFFARSIKND